MTALHLGMFSGNNISTLSSNLHCDDIIKHPDLPWSRNGLSYNATMRLEHWNIINQGWTNDSHLPTKEPTFARLSGSWDYNALMANFERQEPKAIFPLPLTVRVSRPVLRLKSVAQMDWFDTNYGEQLSGNWQPELWHEVLSIDDIRELCRRGIITVQECQRQIASHPNVTLEIIGPIDAKTSPWIYGSLIERLPLSDVSELLRDHPQETGWHASRLFSRTQITRDHFDRWIVSHKELCWPRKGNAFHAMYAPVIRSIGFDYLLQWPDVDKIPWSRADASLNIHLPVGWLMTVFDKWPKVWGAFDINALIGRASITEYILYLRHQIKNGDVDGSKLRSVLAKKSRRDLLPTFLELQQHEITFCPTISDLVAFKDITLYDFYYFHPQYRPVGELHTCFRFPERLYDVDLIFA
jgi:hypothetical protein